MNPCFAITGATLDVAALIDALRASEEPGHDGAFATFIGVVRGRNLDRAVEKLEYEAHAPLAVKSFERIADEARVEWPDTRLAIHHRVGTLQLGEASVAIVAASPHRGAAFAACRYAIERIKQISPIWKREYFEGGDVWLEGATAEPDNDDVRLDARKRACA
ncbi:MAG: molybdenum cofactor biosynthesis protein MoaE [Acidobacteria bacterium]|jgi:molybdopterin synthase catalytic subunit|nr:molybdenum cofactor biosynthesis protein MoaE [Acidobacteriota bacterium]